MGLTECDSCDEEIKGIVALFFISVLDCLPGESQVPYYKDTQAALWGENLGF